ncbi:unnamed protein product [Caenorhabditis brenneri]
MGAVEFLFPLLNLPEKAKKYVLQQMPIVDQTAYSFISASTKNSIAALESNRPDQIVITISNIIGIRVYRSHNQPRIDFRIFNEESDQITPESNVLPIPKFIDISTPLNGVEQTSQMTNYNGLGLKQCLDHFLDLFPPNKCPVLNKTQMTFQSTEREIFPTDLLHDAFKGWDVKEIHIETQFYERLIKKLLLKTEVCYIFRRSPFRNDSDIFIQNFSQLSNIRFITLNNLLMVNSSVFSGVATFKESHLNRFLKCWLRGSNPRLKELRLHIVSRPRTRLKVNLVLQGINHSVATEEEMKERGQFQKLIFPPVYPPALSYEVFGWNIRRIIDGQEATVVFITDISSFEMFLFVDNC